jgi:hypothetical protein
MLPWRTPEQFRQLQFHWGKPPPAAEPNTRICITTQKKKGRDMSLGLFKRLAIGDVHCDFKTKTQINC